MARGVHEENEVWWKGFEKIGIAVIPLSFTGGSFFVVVLRTGRS